MLSLKNRLKRKRELSMEEYAAERKRESGIGTSRPTRFGDTQKELTVRQMLEEGTKDWMKSLKLTSMSFPGPAGPPGPVFDFDLKGGTQEVTGELTALFTSFQNTGKTIRLGDGIYQFSAPLPNVSGFYLEMLPSTILRGMIKTGLSLVLTGSAPCGIIGGTIQNWPSRRYKVSDITQPGGANTAVTVTILASDLGSIGAHDFAAGDTCYLQNIVLTAGSINNTSLTVENVTPTTVTFVAGTRTIDTTAVYPFDRLDGSGVTIYPVIYRSRTAAFGDACVKIFSSNFLAQDLTCQWTAGAGLLHSGASNGRILNTRVIESASDSIHFTNRSHDITMHNVETVGMGDDGIAIVGYKKDGGRVHNIRCVGA